MGPDFRHPARTVPGAVGLVFARQPDPCQIARRMAGADENGRSCQSWQSRHLMVYMPANTRSDAYYHITPYVPYRADYGTSRKIGQRPEAHRRKPTTLLDKAGRSRRLGRSSLRESRR